MSSLIARAEFIGSQDERHRNLRCNEIVENKEAIRLIWFSVNIDDSPESSRIQTMLLDLNSTALFYTDINRCIDLIRSIKDEQVFLILSDPFESTILLHFRHLHTIAAIFIFSTDEHNLIKSMDEDNSFIHVFTDEDRLLKSIRTRMRLVEKQTIAFSTFDEKQESIRDLSKESASFLWYQTLIHILKQMSHDAQSKQEMVEKMKDDYQTNKNMLEKIEKFQLTYTPEKAIESYTDEDFLYKQLNKALRTKDLQLLYSFRFFIIDLCAAIEQKSLEMEDSDRLILYRGQQLSAKEFNQIEKNTGKIISINGFFSTSRDQNVALIFAGQCHKSSAMRSVLFEIEVNPSLTTAAFADVANISRFKDEQEVLFSLNALFRIVSIQYDLTLNVWRVYMVTTNDGPDKTGEYRLSIDEQLVEYSPIIYFGRLILSELDQQFLGRQYFNNLLKSLPSNHPDIASVYNNFGHISYGISDFNSALKYYELAYKIRQEKLSPDNPHIASSFMNLGHIHRNKGNFDRALEYYKAAESINNRNYAGAHIRKSYVSEYIALVLINEKDFDTALSYLFSALDMYKTILPTQHPDIAECLGHIGLVHESMGDLNLALDYYHQQLEIEEVCLPPDHSKLNQHTHWIVNIYKKIGDANAALMFCQKRLNAQKNALNENHPHVARTLTTIASVIQDTDREKAFEHYQEALSILQCSPIRDHQATAECFTAMGCFHSMYGMLDNALEAHLKAVDLYRQILPSDHIHLAHSLRNLGTSYRDMNNILEAKRCFIDSLSIYQANYDSEHEHVKRGMADLADFVETKIIRIEE